MPCLMLKEVPPYECLQEAVERMPGVDPQVIEVFLNLLQTGDVASGGEEAFLAAYGLNQARLIILGILDSCGQGGLRSSELASHAKVSRATITGLLDTLEKAGHIGRAADPTDRRASTVRITRQGQTLLHKVQPLLMKWAEGILSDLSVKERTQLLKLLRKTQAAFSTRIQSKAHVS